MLDCSIRYPSFWYFICKIIYGMAYFTCCSLKQMQKHTLFSGTAVGDQVDMEWVKGERLCYFPLIRERLSGEPSGEPSGRRFRMGEVSMETRVGKRYLGGGEERFTWWYIAESGVLWIWGIDWHWNAQKPAATSPITIATWKRLKFTIMVRLEDEWNCLRTPSNLCVIENSWSVCE